MEVFGHSGISVTMNTYAHVLPELRQEAKVREVDLSFQAMMTVPAPAA